jgi:hypothetical protein
MIPKSVPIEAAFLVLGLFLGAVGGFIFCLTLAYYWPNK